MNILLILMYIPGVVDERRRKKEMHDSAEYEFWKHKAFNVLFFYFHTNRRWLDDKNVNLEQRS